MRRRQNNPILTGEPGVGKTAIVEGFAMRIAAGDVPEPLKNASVRALDLGLLQAGAGVKGEFEHRLKTVIQEVKGSLHPVIVFIDEAHTMIGAGGPEGQGDAANLLKPALSRGELRTVAATTWSEYKKYVEKDPALARRFQVIKVDEPSEQVAREMLMAVVGHLERHHGVRVLEEAVRDAVELSHRHISDRQLPDKAVSVLDTACARVAIGKSAPPVQLEDAIREAEQITLELRVLEREQRSGTEHGDRIENLKRALERAQQTEEKFRARWSEERSLVEEIDETHAMLDGGSRSEDDGDDAEDGSEDVAEDLTTVTERLAELIARLEEAQGEDPLVPTCVNSSVLASVISGWTGIPVGKMVKNEIRTVISLRSRMEDRVIGQPEALESLCRRIGTSQRQSRGPQQAHRRVPPRGPERRGQNRDGAHAGRVPLRGGAEPGLGEHVRVPGGSHGLIAQGSSSGIRGLRHRGHPHGGGSPAPVLGCASRRGRKGRTPTLWSSSIRSSTAARWRTARAR